MQWRWPDEKSSTEEVMWDRIAILTDMWKWFGETIRMKEREMLQNWNE
jgi:hypothetical protein